MKPGFGGLRRINPVFRLLAYCCQFRELVIAAGNIKHSLLSVWIVVMYGFGQTGSLKRARRIARGVLGYGPS